MSQAIESVSVSECRGVELGHASVANMKKAVMSCEVVASARSSVGPAAMCWTAGHDAEASPTTGMMRDSEMRAL